MNLFFYNIHRSLLTNWKMKMNKKKCSPWHWNPWRWWWKIGHTKKEEEKTVVSKIITIFHVIWFNKNKMIILNMIRRDCLGQFVFLLDLNIKIPRSNYKVEKKKMNGKCQSTISYYLIYSRSNYDNLLIAWIFFLFSFNEKIRGRL